MSYKDKLYEWLKENRPEVFAKLDADGVTDIKALSILRDATGVAVEVGERVEVGSKRFLEAFQAAANSAGTQHQQTGSLANRIAAVRVQAAEEQVIRRLDPGLLENLDKANAEFKAKGGCPGCGSDLIAVHIGNCPSLDSGD